MTVILGVSFSLVAQRGPIGLGGHADTSKWIRKHYGAREDLPTGNPSTSGCAVIQDFSCFLLGYTELNQAHAAISQPQPQRDSCAHLCGRRAHADGYSSLNAGNIPVLKPREIVSILHSLGFAETRQTGIAQTASTPPMDAAQRFSRTGHGYRLTA